ncbi:metabolite traffic protein EboE [Membranihabitans marinus]|uniref:metabolite traffic protein EboE n=1 Tax=Membranihabitans marinus TaxID=1227546 RepID=UPI001F3C2D63|nr:metabolite traffic protein EboE [Membranihabitans marinus]
MKIHTGHLTYCSNIHSGEQWEDHFQQLKENFPTIHQKTYPQNKMAIGLRISNAASITLTQEEYLQELKEWLKTNNSYVFTMNGFPYGNFHKTKVKDQVHFPDWTTIDRLNYTLRLFKILSTLLPDNLSSGGISTSPLSYKYWISSSEDTEEVFRKATANIIEVLKFLHLHKIETGQSLHLDIECEPDGLLSNSSDYITWYNEYLLPMAAKQFEELPYSQVKAITNNHIQLCYDICHFAVEFEDPQEAIHSLKRNNLTIGKVQISSAMEMKISGNIQEKLRRIKDFDEPVYLHQVVIQLPNHSTSRYQDLSKALINEDIREGDIWRIHYHVPIFQEKYGLLESTQSYITETLKILVREGLCDHYEVETYTWEVLPDEIQNSLNESIAREIKWAENTLENIN